jgi:hypothetical protein
MGQRARFLASVSRYPFDRERLRHEPPAALTHNGNGSRKANPTMMFKLAQSASRHRRRLNGYHQNVLVIEGQFVIDGVQQNAARSKALKTQLLTIDRALTLMRPGVRSQRLRQRNDAWYKF